MKENSPMEYDAQFSKVYEELAQNLVTTRKKAGLSQKALSDRTGIYQPEISKIEQGLGNPSLKTLIRLTTGLETRLRISFEPVRGRKR